MVTKEEVLNELKKIIDPEVGMDIVEMGLVKDLKVEKDEVSLTFTPSSPFCPLGVQLAFAIKEKLKNMKGIKKVNIKVEGHVQQDMINKMLQEEK